MASTGLTGNFNLTDEAIDRVVAKGRIGVYALGKYNSTENMFYISYVGRSDVDVNDRLHKHTRSGYTHFQFGYFETTRAAFEKECNLYHGFNPPDNKVHPAKPEGTYYGCPVLGCPH